MSTVATTRRCPFCDAAESTPFGIRASAVFVKCRACQSIFQALSGEEFDQLHVEAFSDESFVSGVTGALGEGPDRRTWGELQPFLPGSTYLEIGPGSGHLLAAAREAGRTVSAVESSDVHRSFIRRTWDIDTVYPSFDEIPESATFDGIVAMNTLEHVYSIDSFLSAVRARLAPKGVFLLSTVNPAALSAKLVRTYWSMCKPLDHVSFPSAQGLRTASLQAGLSVQKIWYSELPLETPISVVVAARDYVRSRRSGTLDAGAGGAPSSEPGSVASGGIGGKAISLIFDKGRGIDPTSWALGRVGMATMIKATLVRA
ncbi:MAG: class I SAM-dependent methyltransferase [Acidimicrobiales bacterium]